MNTNKDKKSETPSETFLQITRTSGGVDGVCVSIITDTENIRVQVSPAEFTEAIFGGSKIKTKIVRWSKKEAKA